MGLLLPESFAREAAREAALEEADHIIAERRYWDPKLADIDPCLTLNKARLGAQGLGIHPGMWHVIRRAEPPFTAWVISTNGLGIPGEFREMGDDILETLRRGDMWNRERMREREMEVRRREESRQRAEANHREARREDLALNVKAMINPGVSRSARGARAKARKKA